MILALKLLAADQRDLQARKQAVTQQLRITRKKERTSSSRSAARSAAGSAIATKGWSATAPTRAMAALARATAAPSSAARTILTV